jgi:hypothetical protein
MAALASALAASLLLAGADPTQPPDADYLQKPTPAEEFSQAQDYLFALARAVILIRLAPPHTAAAWYRTDGPWDQGPELVTFEVDLKDRETFVARRTSIAWPALFATHRTSFGADAIAAEARKRGLSRDAVRLLWPNVYAAASEVEVKRQVAREADCPAIRKMLEELEPLMSDSVDIDGVALDTAKADLIIAGGIGVDVGASGTLRKSRSRGGIEIAGNVDSRPAAWAFKAAKALKPCWRPDTDPPKFP